MKRILLLILFLAALCVTQSLSPADAQGEETKEAEALFVAQRAFDDGFYDVAFSLLERFLKNYPSSGKAAEAGLLLGRCYFQQNRFLDALKQFEDLIGTPGGKKIRDALLYWIAEVHFRGNNFSRAAGYYRTVTEDFPVSAYASSAYYSLGWCLTQEQKYAEALNVFKVLETKFPGQPQAQDAAFKVIECLYNLKEYDALKDRVAIYLKSFQGDQQKTLYLKYYLAEAEYYLNDFVPALEHYSQVLSAADTKLRPLALLGQGWAYLKLKRFSEAETAFSGLNPADLEAQSREILFLGKAVISFETGRFVQAQEFYRKLSASGDPLIAFQGSLGAADSLYNRGEYAEAVKEYGSLSRDRPAGEVPADLVDKAQYGLAWALLKLGEFKEAITAFQKIAAQSGDKIFQVSALCQIGDAYQDEGDSVRAAETYEKILRDFPDNFYSDYVRYQLGITLLKAGDHDAAIRNLLGFGKAFPQSKLADDAEYALGLAYFQKKDFVSSRDIFRDFDGTFRESSLASQAAYLFGTSLYNLGQYEQAIEVFKTVIRNYGQDAELVQKAEYEIADCYYQMGDEKQAMERFNQLRVKYPDSSLSAEIMWWLGDYYYRKNDLTMAVRYFSSLINDFRDSPLVSDAHYALGSVFSELSRFEEAVEEFKAVAGSSSEISGQAMIAIADVYMKEDKLQAAIEAYDEAGKKYPALLHLIYPKLAEAWALAGDQAKATGLYEKSLELVPAGEKPRILLKIAEVYQSHGQTEKAVAGYLKITALYAENRELGIKALLRVARIYEEQGRSGDSVNIYRKIEAMDCPESKYARERIGELESQGKPAADNKK